MDKKTAARVEELANKIYGKNITPDEKRIFLNELEDVCAAYLLSYRTRKNKSVKEQVG